ncbi:TPA: redox-regulated ATPase YchF [Candidatus Woesearchaeota archaeon]|nr:redox-regulated ATPase YchF [Candidatus Woesearchaeota archaeon]
MLIGIVGKPSCGKSTFFKAITLADVAIASYPFTTIRPNSGVGHVSVDCPDKDFGTQCHPRMGFCRNHTRFVPVQVIDVAGLVPGAHEGKGMGNQFLDDLRQADVLIHIIDASGSINEKGEPVPALSYDPANDIRFLEEELDLWYLGLIEKGWERFARAMNQEKPQLHKAVAKQLSGLGVTEPMMEIVIEKLGLPEDIMKWGHSTLRAIATDLRKMTKPMVIACNKIDVPGAEKNFERLKQEFSHLVLLPCSAESELALREAAKHGLIDYLPGEPSFTIIDNGKLNEKQKKGLEFMRINILDKLKSTGVQQVMNTAVFDVLKYVAIFPGGVAKLADSEGRVMPDCFLMPPKTTALDFAFRLHTDFGKYFIRALDVRTKKPVGKDYVLHNRDVIEIVSGK